MKSIFTYATTAALSLLIGSSALAQIPEYATSYTISGGGNTIPFYYLGTGCRGQQLYPAGAFGTVPSGQYIERIYMSSTTTGSQLYSNLEIRLKQAAITSLTNTYETGMTEVFNETNYTINRTALQWFYIDLEVPFLYNPTLPLIFEVNQLTSGGASHSSVVQTTIAGSWRNYASGYNAAAATGNGAYTLFFGFDLGSTPVPNNAGVSALPGLLDGFCADTIPINVEITNYGNNTIDSIYVDWEVNGTPQTGQWFELGALDTAGSADNDTVVNIGEYLFSFGNLYEVKAWTSMPNNENDTVNTNDTLTVTTGPGMSGNYVIGTGSGADFPSFTLAAAALNAVGVCDHVVFDVQSGTYTEQFALNNLIGSDSDATVTFRSQAQDSAAVTLTFAGSTQTSVVKMNGADWISFEKMTISNTSTTYDYAFEFTNSAHHNTVTNCRLIGNVASTSSFASIIYSNTGLDNFNTFTNNRFEGSGYGLYWWGSGTAALEEGTVIDNNQFINQYYRGAYLYYQDAPKLRNNYITSNANYGFGAGFYMLYCDNELEISGNHIVSDPTSTTFWPQYGFYLSLSDAATLNNTGRIYNNRIVIGADTTLTNANVQYAAYLTSSNAQRVINNSFTLLNSASTSRTYYHSASNAIYLQNNLFTNYSGGHAAYYLSGIAMDVDHNNYWAPNGFEIYDITGNYELEQFQDNTGWEENGSNLDPQFSNLSEAWLCNPELDGTGEPISNITTDYSGYARHPMTPDPGAVEFIGMQGFNLGPDTTYCGNEHVIEVTGPTNSLVWLVNGQASSSSSITLSASGQPTTFTVNVALSSATGCGSATDAATITLVPSAMLDSNTHICANASEVLSVAGGSTATYQWLPGGQVTGSITVTEPGIYSVTKMEEGCESTTSTMVTQSTAVDVADVEACLVDMPITVDATIPAGVGYAWNGGSAINSAVNTFDAAGIYQVTATDAFGCSSTDEMIVSVLEEPTAAITYNSYNQLFLFNSSTSLFAGNNATYFWSFGDGATSTDANPAHEYSWSSTPTTYTVTLTVNNDCGTDDVSATIVSDPLGVDAVNSILWSVYPNPATESATISGASNGTYEVVDMVGRPAARGSLANSGNTAVDLSTLASGYYTLRVVADGAASEMPLVVE